MCNVLQLSFHFSLHSAVGLPPPFHLLSSMISKSHWFGFLHALWSSTCSLASTLQWASHHYFSLQSLFWLSHCNSPQPSFWSPVLRWASHVHVSLCCVVRPPCLIWPLLCHGPPTLGPASYSAMGLPHLASSPTLCWASIPIPASRARFGFLSAFSLPHCVWPPVCHGPPTLGLASSSLVVLPSPFGLCCPAGLPLPSHLAVSVAGEGRCAVAACPSPQPRRVPGQSPCCGSGGAVPCRQRPGPRVQAGSRSPAQGREAQRAPG